MFSFYMIEGIIPPKQDTSNLEATGQLTQLNILLRRDFLKAKRDKVYQAHISFCSGQY